MLISPSVQSREPKPNLSKYVEVDFANVTSIKARRICMNKTLSSLLFPPTIAASSSNLNTPQKPTVSQGGSRLDSPLYTLLPLDLRKSLSENDTALLDDHLLPLLDPNVPTLFLAECVYCYMLPEESHSLIKWFADHLGKSGCVGVLYEMCGIE